MSETMRKPPNAGKGRPKGARNKVTRALKESLLATFEEIGGLEAMATWARKNQTEFYKICARLIPTEVNASVEGSARYVIWAPKPCKTTEEWLSQNARLISSDREDIQH